jgi:hypothetical protein
MSAPADRSEAPALLAGFGRSIPRPYSVSFDGKLVLGDYVSESGLWALTLDTSANAVAPRSILESDFKKSTPPPPVSASRVSTKGPKRGREQSPENQRKQLRAFAEAMEWSIVAEYEDRESGAKGAKDRPQFNALMEAASRRD